MRAAWYERQGPAAEVPQVGELPEPEPGPGEVRVRVRLRFPGVNPGDTKKRSGWLGNPMASPLVVPHSDGAGVVDSVGTGVEAGRVGRRVWVYGAQSYRPSGTAAGYTVVPAGQAVDLPDRVSDEVGACLGIPGTTAHRAVFGDGPVSGSTVLVHGVLGGVWSLAAQPARWGEATVSARSAAPLTWTTSTGRSRTQSPSTPPTPSTGSGRTPPAGRSPTEPSPSPSPTRCR